MNPSGTNVPLDKNCDAALSPFACCVEFVESVMPRNFGIRDTGQTQELRLSPVTAGSFSHVGSTSRARKSGARNSGEGETMSDSIIQLSVYLLASAVVGGLIGWLVRAGHSKLLLDKMRADWQLRFDTAARQRDKLNAENIRLNSSIEAEKKMLRKHELAGAKIRTELESAQEKIKALAKDMFELGAERDDLKRKLTGNQDVLSASKREAMELQAEFVKAGEFYKGELQKSFEKRTALEKKVADAKLEQQSLANLLAASKTEYESVSNLLASAQCRVKNLDVVEQKVIALEAENAQLRHDAALWEKEIEALKRDVDELEALKAQNRELAHCLESIENSRKQYESDAKRYREQYSHSENESETLRIKLDEVERNLAKLAKKQSPAKTNVKKNGAGQAGNGLGQQPLEIDDLTEIVGIGKVFQQMLHDLGVYSFRQIAAFGPAEVARVNMELKEFKGRMEQDDWIGQAKELHFKKYGGSGEG